MTPAPWLRLAIAAVVLLLSADVFANGSITGSVRVDRLPARAAVLPIVKDAAVCGKEVPNEALLVAPDKGLANVLVSIQGLAPASPPAPAATAVVDQVGCRYTPHVQAVPVGTRLSVVNSDAVLHNVHAVATGPTPATVFNLAMPFKGQKLPTVLRRSGVMKLRCDAGHDWMSAYIGVYDHPYFAVTDPQGRFSIPDVPAGEHQLEIWHEPLDRKGAPLVKTMKVRVTDGKATKIEPVLEL